MTLLILVGGLFLAYVNGANDNFKGVATLFGSGTANYKRALYWATVTTFLGSLAALFLSQGLVAAFSGKGLVPNSVTEMPSFLLAVGIGTAFTVLLATLTGFPISTTHSLVGGLLGAGLASGQPIHFQKLFTAYFLPLFFSPLVSVALTLLVYPSFKKLKEFCGVNGETCFCVGGKEEVVEITPSGAGVLKSTGLTLTVDQISICQTKYMGTIIGVNAHTVLDQLHYCTAGAVSFARGLNDTPKIAALLLAANFMGVQNGIVWISVAIALGGILSARKVAKTMSQRITSMNHGQGFTANLISALLVILASNFSLPVSTTHVTCGSLFGVGLVNGKANWGMIKNILISWILTLPVAALVSALIFIFIK